jgi:aspartyl/asparaginyl beta-hydroxylase
MLSLEPERARSIVATLRVEFGAGLSERVAHMVDACAAPASVTVPSDRRAEQLWLPDLDSRPWHDPREFDWVERLEQSANEIAEECRAVTERAEALEHYLGDPPRTAGGCAPGADGLLPPAHGWRAFFLRRNGIWRRDDCRLCPATTAAVCKLPLSAGDVMFSVLAPRSKIFPHHGLTNLDLTCHLGIDVPDDCALEVAGEARRWREGRVAIFDDTYLHAAYNRSDRPRRVLLFDFWNPRLTSAERVQLKRAMPLLFASPNP